VCICASVIRALSPDLKIMNIETKDRPLVCFLLQQCAGRLNPIATWQTSGGNFNKLIREFYAGLPGSPVGWVHIVRGQLICRGGHIFSYDAPLYMA